MKLTKKQIKWRLEAFDVLQEMPSLTDFVWHAGVISAQGKKAKKFFGDAHCAVAVLSGMMRTPFYRKVLLDTVKAYLENEEF